MHDNQRSNRRTRPGSRNRRDRGGRSYGGSGPARYQETGNEPGKAPEKLGFWQRLMAAFFGTKPDAAAQNGRPQQNGHRRFESAPRPARKPELIEVSSPKLYVGNLSFDATESDLFDLFNGVGQVQNAEIVSNKYTQKSKGFAFVVMLTVEEARRAVAELHDKEFMGRKLVVSGAKTSDVRPGGPDSREPESEPAAPAS